MEQMKYVMIDIYVYINMSLYIYVLMIESEGNVEWEGGRGI